MLRRLSRETPCKVLFLVQTLFYSRSKLLNFLRNIFFHICTHSQILSRTQCPLSTKNYFHITRTIIFSQNPRLASYNIHHSFILKIPRLFLHFPNPSLHIYTSSELTLRHTSLRDPRSFFNFYVSHVHAHATVPFSRNLFPFPNTFSPYFHPLAKSTIPREKTSFSKPQPFRARAAHARHTCHDTYFLPPSLPPSNSFTRAPFRQRVGKLGVVRDGVTSRKPGSISRRAIRSTAKTLSHRSALFNPLPSPSASVYSPPSAPIPRLALAQG